MTSAAPILAAAQHFLQTTDAATAGLWPRATALLARQAIEAALADLWSVRFPGMENCSYRAQLLCLGYYLGDERLAEQTSYAWACLSRACHQHPYELPPTSNELLESVSSAEALIHAVGKIKSRPT